MKRAGVFTLAILLFSSPAFAESIFSNATLPTPTEDAKLRGDDGKTVEAYSQTGLSFQIARTPSGKKQSEAIGLLQFFDKNGNRLAGYSFKGFQNVSARWADERRLYLRIELGGGSEGLALFDGRSGRILYSDWISP